MGKNEDVDMRQDQIFPMHYAMRIWRNFSQIITEDSSKLQHDIKDSAINPITHEVARLKSLVSEPVRVRLPKT